MTAAADRNHLRPRARHPVRLGLSLALLALVGGCFGPRKDNLRNYTMQVPAPAKATERHRGTLLVGDLDVARMHDRQQMLIRRSDVEVHYEHDQLWADRPQTLISDALAASFADAGLFSAVCRNVTDRPPSWVMAGRVGAFEVRVRAGRWVAHLALHLELRRFASDEIIWRMAFDAEEPATVGDHVSAARGLSALLARALGQAHKSLAAAALVADNGPPRFHSPAGGLHGKYAATP